MKLLTTIGKNLKLLFRSRESAYTIIAGPLLIILLVSFAFMDANDDYTIRVGTYAPVQTSFSGATIGALNEENYMVSVYADEESCIESVKTGTTHACMVFGENEAGNGTIPVTFYLDMSRTNIIYQIADDLEGKLDIQADSIRNALATDALTRMSSAAVLIDRSLNKTEQIGVRFAQINADLATTRAAIGQLSNDSINFSIRELRGYQLGLASDTRVSVEKGTQSIDLAIETIDDIERLCTGCDSEFRERVKETRESLENTRDQLTLIGEEATEKKLFEADLMLQYAIEDLAALNASLANNTAARQAIDIAIADASKDGESNEREIKQVITSLQYTKEFLEGNTVSAEDIASPVSTSVVSVTVANDRLSFAYPYLLVLVIMFIGMLLASTLIVADKTSRAKFRNFTTPTPDAYHIVVAFITAFIILSIQIAIILAASSLFVAQPLFLNPLTTIVMIAITIILFTFLGMIIGYLSSTQEAAMIASISVGSVLLFVSNLIIPVEGMAAAVQFLTKFNPYLVLSELLKRSMLYGVSPRQISHELLALLLLAAVLLFITIMIQRRMRRKYFRQEGGLLASHIPAPLKLGERVIGNEIELLDALDHMTRSEFEHLVKSEENVISAWVGQELRNKSLAKQLRTTSKEKMMLRLDEHLKSHAKRIKR